jgi:hypothetical protein
VNDLTGRLARASSRHPLLLPAVLAILGERTWYLPRRLGWLPHLDIDPPSRNPQERIPAA